MKLAEQKHLQQVQDSEDKKRARALQNITLWRWGKVLFVTFLFACIVPAVFILWKDNLKFPPILFFFVMTSLCTGLFFHFGKGRWRGFLGFKHFFIYPPMWPAFVSGLGLGFLIHEISEKLYPEKDTSQNLPIDITQIQLPYSTWAIGLIPLTLLITTSIFFCMWQHFKKQKTKHQTNPTNNTEDKNLTEADKEEAQNQPTSLLELVDKLQSLEDFRNWFESESPIQNENEDLLDIVPTAERIAERIYKAPLGKELPTQMILGEAGCGKSSTVNIVENLLKEDEKFEKPNLLFVRVEAGRYASAQSATQGILQSVIDQLSEEINVDGLRSLPEHYVQATQAVNPILGSLLLLWQNPKSPNQILEQIDKVTQRLGLEILITIEDLERYIRWDVHAHRPNTRLNKSQQERVRPLWSLVDQINQTQSIGLIITTTHHKLGNDSLRLAEFTERLLPINSYFTEKLLDHYRKLLLEEFEIDGLIDPVTTFNTNERDKLNQNEHLSKTIINLRELKTILRDFDESWKKLKGEIDIDDLFSIHTIKETEPILFERLSELLIATNYESLYILKLILRLEPEEREKEGIKDKNSLTKSPLFELHNSIQEYLRRIDPEPLGAIMNQLAQGRKTGHWDQNDPAKPQALLLRSHDSFINWQAFIISTKSMVKNSDQSILKKAKRVNEGNNVDEVASLVFDSESEGENDWRRHIILMLSCIDFEHVLTLGKKLVQHYLANKAKDKINAVKCAERIVVMIDIAQSCELKLHQFDDPHGTPYKYHLTSEKKFIFFKELFILTLKRDPALSVYFAERALSVGPRINKVPVEPYFSNDHREKFKYLFIQELTRQSDENLGGIINTIYKITMTKKNRSFDINFKEILKDFFEMIKQKVEQGDFSSEVKERFKIVLASLNSQSKIQGS